MPIKLKKEEQDVLQEQGPETTQEVATQEATQEISTDGSQPESKEVVEPTPDQTASQALINEAAQTELSNFEKQQVLSRKNANAVAANWSVAWVSGGNMVVANNGVTNEHFEGTMDAFNELLESFRK